MGNAVILNHPQCEEFKNQLRIIIHRFKGQALQEAEIREQILEFYGFPRTGFCEMKQRIEIRSIMSTNKCRVRSIGELRKRLNDLYLSEGISDSEISQRLTHIENFIGTLPPGNTVEPLVKKQESISNLLGRSDLEISSISHEESAEEAYVRAQDERRASQRKAKVVAVQTVDLMKKRSSNGYNTSASRNPSFSSSSRQLSVSSNSSDIPFAPSPAGSSRSSIRRISSESNNLLPALPALPSRSNSLRKVDPALTRLNAQFASSLNSSLDSCDEIRELIIPGERLCSLYMDLCISHLKNEFV